MLRRRFAQLQWSRTRFIVLAAVSGGLAFTTLWAAREVKLVCHLRAARAALDAFDAETSTLELIAAEKLMPQSAEIQYLLGTAERKAGRFDMCGAHLDKARKLGWPANEVRFQSLLLAFQTGDQRAEPVIQQMMALRMPDDMLEDAYEALTIGYLADYRTVEAGRTTDRWLHLRPRRVRAMLLRAEVFGASGRIHEQLEQYEKVLAAEPDNYAAHLGIAYDLLDEHYVERALQEYRWCADRKTGDITPLLGVAACYERQSELEKAADVLRDSLHQASRPDERARATGALGKLLYQDGKLSDAIVLLTESTKLNPYDEQNEYALAMCLVKRGELNQAERHKQRFRELEELQRRVRAVKLAIACQPHDAQLRYEGGLLIAKLGNPKGAAAMMLGALRCDPRHTGARMQLAEYYHDLGRDDLAQEQEALTVNLAETAAPQRQGGGL